MLKKIKDLVSQLKSVHDSSMPSVELWNQIFSLYSSSFDSDKSFLLQELASNFSINPKELEILINSFINFNAEEINSCYRSYKSKSKNNSL